MAIATNSILQYSILGEYSGSRILFVRSFRLKEPPLGSPTAQEIQEAFLNTVGPGDPADLVGPYLDCLTAGYTAIRHRAQIVTPVRYSYSAQDFPGGTIGTRGATGTALLDAVITGRTALSGRDQVSNFKIGPAAASDFTAGEVGVDLKANLELLASNIIGSVTVDGAGDSQWTPGIWHSKVALPVVAFDDYIDVIVQDTARAKTGRTLGRGE